VSLPTPRFVLLIVERDELMADVDALALRDVLSGDPTTAPAAPLQIL
jgi:hypothetical protein